MPHWGWLPRLSQSQHPETTIPIKTFRNYFSNWQPQPEAPERYQALDIWGARASALVDSGWTPGEPHWPHLRAGVQRVQTGLSEVPTDPMVMPERQNWWEREKGRRPGWGTRPLKSMLLFFGMGEVQEALSGPSINNLYFQDHRKVESGTVLEGCSGGQGEPKDWRHSSGR